MGGRRRPADLVVASFVLGAGGLLGSEVDRLCRDSFEPALSMPSPVPWHDAGGVSEAVRGVVDRAVEDHDAAGVVAFWCAGVGHVGSSVEELASTTVVFAAVLDELGRAAARGVRIHLSFASSAGAVWAGAGEGQIDEATPVAPIHPYGRAKLEEERLAAAWASAPGRSVTIARISNLFGSNQDPEKRQGLITKLVRGALRGEPTPVFVPLDTSRDFLPASTAAQMLVADALAASGAHGAATSIRLVAAGRSHTVAQVCGVLQRLRRRRVPLVHVVSDQTSRQPPRLEFRTRRPFTDVAVPSLEESLRMMYDDEIRRLVSPV